MLKSTFAVLLFLFFALFWGNLQAQDSLSNRALAKQAIQSLKNEAVLVVAFRSNASKKRSIEAILQDPELSPQRRNFHQKRLEEMEDYAQEINRGLLHGMSLYTFSERVYWTWDTTMVHLRRGASKGYLLDTLQQAQADWELPQGKPVYVLTFRERDAVHPYDYLYLQPLEGYLQPPFPYLQPVRASFIENSRTVLIRRSLERWNKRLINFYKKQFN
jgi:hypothetical protein